VLFASLLLTAAWRWGMRSFFLPDGFPGNTEKIFYSYTSPTIALAAICLLLLHARLTGPGSRFMEKASSAALGVFLLHTTVWNWLIVPCAGLLSPLPRSFAWLNVLGSALVITLLCIPVDLLRGRLFTLLGIPSFAEKLHARFSALCGRIAEKAS
jgi:surface polysaccharide O-acyltransferase-like enzyme